MFVGVRIVGHDDDVTTDCVEYTEPAIDQRYSTDRLQRLVGSISTVSASGQEYAEYSVC